MATKSKGPKESKDDWKEKKNAILPIFILEVVSALVLSVGWLYGGYYYCDFIPVPEMQPANVWNYYVRCCILPCIFVLFFTIWAVMNKRGSTAAGNPLAGRDNLLLIEKNILSNTVEQLLLFVLVTVVLTTFFNQYEMKLLPLFSSFWVFGRILFNIGYRIGFQYRSLGMLCNVFPTIYFIGMICYFLYTRGLWSGIAVTACGGSGGAGAGKSEL